MNIHKLNGFIYVTSEGKPKAGNYSIATLSGNKEIVQLNQSTCIFYDEFIILTNDRKLTNVQQLTPKEEAYCKTVDSVEVEYTVDFNSKAVIVIPKQETIEEVAYNYAEVYRCPATNKDEYCKHDIISAINFGYNHAVKTLYTEEEVLDLLYKQTEYFLRSDARMTIEEFFNQYKKK